MAEEEIYIVACYLVLIANMYFVEDDLINRDNHCRRCVNRFCGWFTCKGLQYIIKIENAVGRAVNVGGYAVKVYFVYFNGMLQ